MEKKKLDNKIEDARRTLIKLYKKYTEELFEITTKIDKYLEGLQDAKSEE